MPQKNNKLFIVRTYVLAKDIPSALKLAKKTTPYEVFVDEDYFKMEKDVLFKKSIGFKK